LPEKTLSDPVRVASGFAILRVLERQGTTPTGAAGQRDEVAAALRDQKRSELFRAFLLEARERYPIARHASAYRRAIGAQE
jgi:parvulin-like peptidyl-prolyl isomerase